jgi:hypothetical protein
MNSHFERDFTYRYTRYVLRHKNLSEMEVLDISNVLYEYYLKPFAHDSQSRFSLLQNLYNEYKRKDKLRVL